MTSQRQSRNDVASQFDNEKLGDCSTSGLLNNYTGTHSVQGLCKSKYFSQDESCWVMQPDSPGYGQRDFQ